MKPDDSTRDVVRELLLKLIALVPQERHDYAVEIARAIDGVVDQEEQDGEALARDLLDIQNELEELEEDRNG